MPTDTERLDWLLEQLRRNPMGCTVTLNPSLQHSKRLPGGGWFLSVQTFNARNREPDSTEIGRGYTGRAMIDSAMDGESDAED